MTSYEYTRSTLTQLYEVTDAESFKHFTEKIPFYADFQKVRQILETIKAWTTDEANTLWAGYDSGKELLFDLNADIEKIRFCDFETLERLNLEFAPTSTYQEVSLSNGWADEYIVLAEQFDSLYRRIKANRAR